MNSKFSIKYTAHDLTNFFSKQPGDLKACPNCGCPLFKSKIAPSKIVLNHLSDPHLIAVHTFSNLDECRTCQWWSVRESWALCELGKDYDFLVVGEAAGADAERADQGPSPWKQVFEDEHLYHNVAPLPENLVQLFDVAFFPKLDPGDKISLRDHSRLYQPTYYGPMYSYAGRGSRGTIISFEEYVLEYQQLSQAGKIDLDYTKNFQAIWLPAAKRELEKGTHHAMRLDKLEPIFFDRASGQSPSKEGEIYLVEIQNVEKCA